MTGQLLRCTLCDHTEEVSEEDPDSSLSEIVQHVRDHHAYDPRLMHAAVALEPRPRGAR
jgi:hypothetical protein